MKSSRLLYAPLCCGLAGTVALAQFDAEPLEAPKPLIAPPADAAPLADVELYAKQEVVAPRRAPGSPAAGPALDWIELPPAGVPAALESGPCDGAGEEAVACFEEEVRVPGWRWIRVFFEDCQLGARSFVRLTSLADGDVQMLDSAAVRAWRGASAYFNGDAVLVELVVDPRDRDVFVRVAGVTGDPADLPPPAAPETLCGNDDRVGSGDARVCRIALGTGDPANPSPNCTGWLTSNGAVLTAGHCVDFDPDGSGPLVPDGVVEANFLSGVVQFNVPLSDCDGPVNHPPAADQYPIDAVTGFSFPGAGMSVGRDWAVFSILPNGSDSAHVRRGWFRLTSELPATGGTVRVTGFGVDATPAGCGPSPVGNAQNQTNQTATGGFNGEQASQNAVQLNYAVDTMPANSGSPVIWEAQNLAIGVHTTGGCTAQGGNNTGTSFELDALENAVAGFAGANPRYVDNAHPISVARDGSVFRPFVSFAQGVNATPAGGVLTITPGTYAGSAMTISTAMTIRAPGGTTTVTQ